MSQRFSSTEQKTSRQPNAESLLWHSPSGAPVLRHQLCGLCQPLLKREVHTPQFLFHDATVLVILSGHLNISEGGQQLLIDAPTELLLIERHTHSDLKKTPAGDNQIFRSIFLTLSAELLDLFHRTYHAVTPPVSTDNRAFKRVPLDDDLLATLYHVVGSVEKQEISDVRLQYRLLDFLVALAERGHTFAHIPVDSISSRLRTMIFETPEKHWTAETAGKIVAMSPATLRRRLATEQVRFEDLLIDARMHYGMMLLQSTKWDMARIAEACGYKSRVRFAERFQKLFGCSPSAMR